MDRAWPWEAVSFTVTTCASAAGLPRKTKDLLVHLDDDLVPWGVLPGSGKAEGSLPERGPLVLDWGSARRPCHTGKERAMRRHRSEADVDGLGPSSNTPEGR